MSLCNQEADYALTMVLLGNCFASVERDAVVAYQNGNVLQATALSSSATTVNAAIAALAAALLFHRGLEHSDDPNHEHTNGVFIEAFVNHTIQAADQFFRDNNPLTEGNPPPVDPTPDTGPNTGGDYTPPG